MRSGGVASTLPHHFHSRTHGSLMSSFLLFGSSAARSDWQMLRNPHHLAIMLTSSFIVLLSVSLCSCWHPEDENRTLASYISVWEDFGKLGVLSETLPLLGGKPGIQRKERAGSLSLNCLFVFFFFSKKTMDKIPPKASGYFHPFMYLINIL